MPRKRKNISRVPRIESASNLIPVIVEWLDASTDSDFDGPLTSLPPTGTCVNRTIGFLVEITAREVLVVRDVTHEENTVRWPYSIPRVLVRKITHLAEASE